MFGFGKGGEESGGSPSPGAIWNIILFIASLSFWFEFECGVYAFMFEIGPEHFRIMVCGEVNNGYLSYLNEVVCLSLLMTCHEPDFNWLRRLSLSYMKGVGWKLRRWSYC